MTNDQKDAVIINALRNLPFREIEPSPNFTANVLKRVAQREAGRARRRQYAFAPAFVVCLTLLGIQGQGVRARDQQLAAMRSAQARFQSAQARLQSDRARLQSDRARLQGAQARLAGELRRSETAATKASAAAALERDRLAAANAERSRLESQFERSVDAMTEVVAALATP